MNYFGKFVTGFKYFYDEINPSNLTGAIDVVVVKDEQNQENDNEIIYRSSPFHVKFGKYDILRPKERKVDITVNGIPVDLKMKLGGAGEAYFPKPNKICNCRICVHQATQSLNRSNDCEITLDDHDNIDDKYDIHMNVLSDSELYEYSNDKKKRTMSESELEELPNRSSKTVSRWDWGELPKTVNNCKLTKKSIKNKNNDLDNSQSFTSEGDIISTSDMLSRCSIDNNSPSNSYYNSLQKINKNTPNENKCMVTTSSPSKVIDTEMPNIGELPFLFECRISLCGELCGSNKKPMKFEELLLTYETLTSQPNILYDKDTVVEINDKYYSWMVAAPMMISAYIFRKHFPKECVKNLKMQYKQKKKMGWFAWRNKSNEINDRVTSDDDNDREINPHKNKDCNHSKNVPLNKCKRRVLKLESNDIEKLGLKNGANEISFTVTSKFQGTVTIRSRIFLWDKCDKIVISDIDGTITKSDVLGHVMYFVGKEWVHRGVTTVLNQIQSNGYRIMYLSSRTIGIADITRNFIQNVNTDEMRLPEGPILLSPSSLFQTIHVEVIEKKPELFKIGCLTDIHSLFPSPINPFYAGFGNRINDAVAYKTLGINESRIFIINSYGLIKSEYGQYQSITFRSLSTYINHIFPEVDHDDNGSPYDENPAFHNYSDMLFWKSSYFIKSDNVTSSNNSTVQVLSTSSSNQNSPSL